MLIKTCSVFLDFCSIFCILLPCCSTKWHPWHQWKHVPVMPLKGTRLALQQLGHRHSRSTFPFVCLHHSGNSAWEQKPFIWLQYHSQNGHFCCSSELRTIYRAAALFLLEGLCNQIHTVRLQPMAVDFQAFKHIIPGNKQKFLCAPYNQVSPTAE